MLKNMLPGYKGDNVIYNEFDGDMFWTILLAYETEDVEPVGDEIGVYGTTMFIVKFDDGIELVDSYWCKELWDCWLHSDDLEMVADMIGEDIDSTEDMVADMWYQIV